MSPCSLRLIRTAAAALILTLSNCRTNALQSPCDQASRTAKIARVERQYDSILVALEAPSAICLRSPLPLRFVLRNVAGRQIRLTHTAGAWRDRSVSPADRGAWNGGFAAGFGVYDDRGYKLWDSDAMPDTPEVRPLAAGDSLEYHWSWNGDSDRDPKVSPGVHRVIAWAWIETAPQPRPKTPPLHVRIVEQD